MTTPNADEVNTGMTGDDIHSSGSPEVEVFGNATSSSMLPITLEELARQNRVATDPLTKQLDKLYDIMEVHQWITPRCSEETSGLFQTPSR